MLLILTFLMLKYWLHNAAQTFNLIQKKVYLPKDIIKTYNKSIQLKNAVVLYKLAEGHGCTDLEISNLTDRAPFSASSRTISILGFYSHLLVAHVRGRIAWQRLVPIVRSAQKTPNFSFARATNAAAVTTATPLL